MPQLAAWEKVYINPEQLPTFQASAHGELPCESCHSGDPELIGENSEENMASAHAGLIAEPSSAENIDETCRYCHPGISAKNETSMHANLTGEKNFLAQRAGAESFEALPPSVKEGYDKDCYKCHTTCGDCHVTRPNSVESGFLNSHMFQSPDRDLNCTACHGSRVGEEYLGERDAQRDVHYIPGAMHCIDCHDQTEMHGDGTEYPHRMSVDMMPRCEDCHSDVTEANHYHEVHWGDMSCSVCHSQEYKNCNSCHAGEGLAEPSYIDFKIGLNPLPEERDYEYVTLRHIPISKDTYKNWGLTELSNFTVMPTWKYTVPHNIRRWTARTDTSGGKSCMESCHIDGANDAVSRSYFLLQDSLEAQFPESEYPGEIEANSGVVVDDALPPNWLQ